MMRFEWDPKTAAANAAWHGVSFAEAGEAFRDLAAVIYPDELHSFGEARVHLIGYSTRQLLLLVVYVERRADVMRIIFARPVTKRERKMYEEGA